MNALLLQPYLFFSGRCEEALEFYFGVSWMIGIAEKPTL